MDDAREQNGHPNVRLSAPLRLILSLCLTMATPLAAHAQSLFSPVLQIDGYVITEFEVEQRIRFFDLLNAPGEPRSTAIERLTEA